MAKNYKNISYFSDKPEVVKIFDDLDKYLDFCRFELRDFNPAHLYDKSNENYRAYVNSMRPNTNRWQDKRTKKRYDQNFSSCLVFFFS